MKKIADTIENSTNGKPLQNAVVTMLVGSIPQTLYLTNDTSSPVSSVSTNEDGYYEFYIPDGTYTFRAAYGDIEKTVEDFEVYDESEQRAALAQAQADIDALEAADAALPVFASGTYTPTLTNTANISSSTAYACFYVRRDDYVTVFGKADITPTASPMATRLNISLPIASNFANEYDCFGSGAAATINQSCGIFADAGTDEAQITFLSTGTAGFGMRFSFRYRII